MNEKYDNFLNISKSVTNRIQFNRLGERVSTVQTFATLRYTSVAINICDDNALTLTLKIKH